MKYGIYYNEIVPPIEDFTDGAYIAIICEVKDYVNRIVNLEDAGWEVRDCIKFFTQGDSLQIALLRKEFKGTVVNNILTNGCGGINIDGCRIPSPTGRFPANMILDKAAGAILDVQAPKSGNMYDGVRKKQSTGGTGHTLTREHKVGESAGIYDGIGGASRFFQQCNTIDDLKAYLRRLIDPEA